MTRVIDPGVIVGGKIVLEAARHGSHGDLLRTAAAALGDFDGQSFVPQGRLGSAFLKGERPSSRVTMTLPSFSGATGHDNSWLSLAVDSYDPKPLEVIFLSIHMGRLGEQVDLEWAIGLEVMPRLVVELSPTLAFMNAWSLDNDGGTFPPEEPLPDLHLPKRFTAWTYIGTGLGETIRDNLGQLPAAGSTPLGNGWLVQAVQRIQDAPQQGFVDALRGLGSDYLPPKLGATR